VKKKNLYLISIEFFQLENKIFLNLIVVLCALHSCVTTNDNNVFSRLVYNSTAAKEDNSGPSGLSLPLIS
jgi:hypothetical protein